MKRRILIVALALGWSMPVAAADPMRVAQAAPAFLPAYEIATIVRSAGFDPLSPAARRGEFYVLRAAAPDGREMRIIVDGRRGRIVSSTPVVAAARGVPGERLGPYERMDDPDAPDGYVPPGPRGAEAPTVYEGDRPLIYERRPSGSIPNVPDRRAAVPDAAERSIPNEPPPVIMHEERGARQERGEHGLLPPPPERFPPRVAPATKPVAKPAPVKRAAAAPPATPPLPKPKPAAAETAGSEAPPASWPGAEASPAPQPAPDGKVDPRSLPH